MGDRVEVRNSDFESWKSGTVKDIVDGRPKVQPDTWDKVYFWNKVQRLVSILLFF